MSVDALPCASRLLTASSFVCALTYLSLVCLLENKNVTSTPSRLMVTSVVFVRHDSTVNWPRKEKAKSYDEKITPLFPFCGTLSHLWLSLFQLPQLQRQDHSSEHFFPNFIGRSFKELGEFCRNLRWICPSIRWLSHTIEELP